MRRSHFEALKPLCPVCRGEQRESELAVASVALERAGDVIEGVLRCPHGECLREYPVIDGIPLIIAPIREYVSANITQIHARADLSETLEGILGDCCGPGSAFDATRQQLSSYAWDHYGDLDSEEEAEGPPRPGSVVRLLERALALKTPAGEPGGPSLRGRAPRQEGLGQEVEPQARVPGAGPAIDVGCAAGRTTFELAGRTGGLVLGVDLNFAMLRTASHVLRRGVARYPRRRVGLVYDHRNFEVRLPAAENVDFWACDAAALPFSSATFATAASLNVIDCVASPAAALAELARVLAPGGKALIASPYDWSPGATPVESWLGGHSQRGEGSGASEPALRRLLGPGTGPAQVAGLAIVAEEPSVPWHVRIHERSTMEYRVHLLAAEKSTL